MRTYSNVHTKDRLKINNYLRISFLVHVLDVHIFHNYLHIINNLFSKITTMKSLYTPRCQEYGTINAK